MVERDDVIGRRAERRQHAQAAPGLERGAEYDLAQLLGADVVRAGEDAAGSARGAARRSALRNRSL